MQPTLESLLARTVEDEHGCWVWTGYIRDDGYPIVSSYGRAYAHRVVYEQLVGRIPRHMFIERTCDQRACVNPSHMRLRLKRKPRITDPEAGAAAAKVGPGARTHCINGHRLSGRNVWRHRGERHCRACHRERELRRYHAKKAA